MKAVIFCGGLPLRVTEQAAAIPKPMMMIGYRPILWHLMRWYSHWGVDEFVLCLGYGGDVIKRYFLTYNEALSNDFVMAGGSREVELLRTDIADWRITFADTGLAASVGQRLRSVRHHLEGEEIFCANYGDVVSDAPLDAMLDDFRRSDAVAAFLSVRPAAIVGHVVGQDEDGRVTAMEHVSRADLWTNGGYFLFRQAIFDYLGEGEDLADEPFRRLIAEGKLRTYRHDGYYVSLDTLRDMEELERRDELGDAPWEVWRAAEPPGADR